jgi:hypothetical protein
MNYAYSLQKMNRIEEAAKLETQAKGIRERIKLKEK